MTLVCGLDLLEWSNKRPPRGLRIRRGPWPITCSGGISISESTPNRMFRDIIENGGQGIYQLLCCNCNRMKQLYPEDYAKPPTYGPLEGAKC